MSRTHDLALPIIEPKLPFHIQVTGNPRYGGTGQVYYSGGPYVLKLAYRTNDSRQMFQNEQSRYRTLESAGVQGLARCHGMFRSVDDLALVFDDGGRELNDFDELDDGQRYVSFRRCMIMAEARAGNISIRSFVVFIGPVFVMLTLSHETW